MAKRFQFKLAPVLRLRKQRENEQRRVVASFLRDVQTGQKQLTDIEQALSDTRSAATIMRKGGTIDITWEQQNRKWQECLVRRINKAKVQLQQSQGRLRDAQTELATRARDVKALEKLHQKRFDAFQYDLRRAEQYETDEIAANMSQRNRAENIATTG